MRNPEANRLGFDYHELARGFAALPYPIVDVHTHVNGTLANEVYLETARDYGIGLTYSMTWLDEIEDVRARSGDRIRFIAMAGQREFERLHGSGFDFASLVSEFHEKGCRVLKFWSAPRGRDMGEKYGNRELLRLGASHLRTAMKRAVDLGMMFLTHVGDPDTWFGTKYADASRYGTKPAQYEDLEECLDLFPVPWIAAHMGGWPENLEFLDGLLSRHPNLSLDTSATKWMVRELSRHSRADLLAFLEKWRERILFGSDIVTQDSQIPQTFTHPDRREFLYQLYASRYWALRTLLETDYDGESPIVDPDLMMVDKERFDESSAPPLRGKSLPAHILRAIYHDNAERLLAPYFR